MLGVEGSALTLALCQNLPLEDVMKIGKRLGNGAEYLSVFSSNPVRRRKAMCL